MQESAARRETLSTTSGDYPLVEYRLRSGGREWSALHTGAVLTRADEQKFLREMSEKIPYGVALWPSAIALAHEVAARDEAFRGARVLELGADVGLPGVVAATLGARVTQTDRHELAMHVGRLNGQRSDAAGITYRLADWTEWSDDARYDWILGSDIFYNPAMHEPLQRIFARNLAPGGRALVADPFREASLRLLEAMEAAGWRVVLTRWDVGEEGTTRPIGVFEMTPP